MSDTNHSAKFAFFYMLSLVALIFMALAAGMIIFQLINKYITDPLNQFSGSFSSDQLKFAISALIISTPIYFLTMRQIFKNIFSGQLSKDLGVRRWLTYLILFVAAVVMIGWLIGVVNSFLGGELTAKFVLKALAAILIAVAIFSFYLYDIRREDIAGKKDKVLMYYLIGSLIVIVAIFITSLFIVESPTATRNRRVDDAVLNKFNNIDSALITYYNDNEKLPADLGMLRVEVLYLRADDIEDPVSGKPFDYRVLENDKYELCADFRTSNLDPESPDIFVNKRWPHDAGYQCLSQKIEKSQELIREVPLAQ